MQYRAMDDESGTLVVAVKPAALVSTGGAARRPVGIADDLALATVAPLQRGVGELRSKR